LKTWGRLWYSLSMDQDSPNTEKHLIFTIQDRRYALPSKLINEVAAFEKAFPLPLLPAYVRGIINRYSVPYALIDIGFLLTKNPTGNSSPGTNTAKLIVLKEEVDKIAFLIDDITDIADILPKDLLIVEQSVESSDEAVEFARSGLIHASFEWKGNRIFCLEITELISQIKKGI
jgi:purine-binding chemotaxis protein CheW